MENNYDIKWLKFAYNILKKKDERGLELLKDQLKVMIRNAEYSEKCRIRQINKKAKIIPSLTSTYENAEDNIKKALQESQLKYLENERHIN